jgi:hypothetical protein
VVVELVVVVELRTNGRGNGSGWKTIIRMALPTIPMRIHMKANRT